MLPTLRKLLWPFLLVIVPSAYCQTPPWAPEFRYGTSYAFEQMTATRQVNDKFDHGRITLVANIYRPVKNDAQKVVLFSHDSTGGWVRSPKESIPAPPPAVLEFFIAQGFTIVAPMRRGVGFSTGTYREECPLSAGQCTVGENTSVSIAGLQEAIKDTDAVIDQIILKKLRPRNSQILLAGISRGGFLSIIMAARRPALALGVLNFVGGWLSISDVFPASENTARSKFQEEHLNAAGKSMREIPTLWLYASRDIFYTEAVTRQFFKTFTAAGGRGEYVFVQEHALANGHQIATLLRHWQAPVNQLLTQLSH